MYLLRCSDTYLAQVTRLRTTFIDTRRIWYRRPGFERLKPFLEFVH